jgi:endonuclease YncB( thermonuclease family)
MRKILVILGIAAFGAAAFALGRVTRVSPSEKALSLDIVDNGIYRVRAAVDGDTVVLENGLHLRMNGINAPETGRFVKDYSPMSKEATAKVIELVEGKRVRVKLAPDRLDMHGRIVGNLFVVPDDRSQPEIDVRQVMLKCGYAKAMGLGVAGDEYKTLKAWQDEAKAAQLGIWGVKNKAKAVEDVKPFCAASSSKTYHRIECAIAKRISPANWHEYATAEEAETVGLKPCANCLGKK